jgi:hypothetical protein
VRTGLHLDKHAKWAYDKDARVRQNLVGITDQFVRVDRIDWGDQPSVSVLGGRERERVVR